MFLLTLSRILFSFFQQHFKMNSLYSNIDISWWKDLFVNEGRLRTFNKNEHLALQGEPALYAGYIKTGYMKYWSPKQNTNYEFITGFSFEGELVGAYPELLYGKPAMSYITAGTNSEVYLFSGKRLLELYNSSLKNSEQGRLLMEAYFMQMIDRIHDYCFKSPRERYLDLMLRSKDKFNTIFLNELASYLNITLTQLSRIRSDLSKQ